MLKSFSSDPGTLAQPAVLPLAQTAPAERLSRVAVPSLDEETDASSDSLFEHFSWLYIFCRERLFRDDTERMIKALWSRGVSPEAGAKLIELGCGPGFYSCRLAERFPELQVLGVDRSAKQLAWARDKRTAKGLTNCRFKSDNVLELSLPDESFDTVIASRLFTVLPNRRRAVAEIHRVLKPGGRCFIAEPRWAFWASIPLFTMWLLAGLTHYKNGYREPTRARVLSLREMNRLFGSQPWRKVETWREGRYQYALCEKA
ncbi:MAG TPA: class I SAM-dependent methyltransferase [Chthoniobacterales bacterium]|nr:class I SAM-dependent methyltransferase [Chthoniobacterales bacterium]